MAESFVRLGIRLWRPRMTLCGVASASIYCAGICANGLDERGQRKDVPLQSVVPRNLRRATRVVALNWFHFSCPKFAAISVAPRPVVIEILAFWVYNIR